MAKVKTKWKTELGSDTVTANNAGFDLLLEDGGLILLENNEDHHLLLEDSSVTPKSRTAWEVPTKNRTIWEDKDGTSTFVTGVSENRVTEDGQLRVTEAGEQLVTEDIRIDKKKRTEWTE